MITSILLTLALMLAPLQPSTSPSDADKVPDKQTVTKAIEQFLQDPKMGEDAKTIKKFAEMSDDCMVAIDEHVLTWANHQPTYKETEVLLTAFVAGNVQSQLKSGKAEDDSYAGLLAALKTYDKLREANKDL